MFNFGLSAQVIQNNTIVYIGEGIEVVSPASIITASFLQNNGKISLKGDWQNQGIYQGLGELALAGTLEQSVYNNDQDITRLTIEGGGDKVIQGLLTVDGRLSLVDGIVYTTEGGSLVLTTEADINGGNDRSYINGALTHKGTGYKFYPIGKGGRYLPVEFIDTNGATPATTLEAFYDPAFHPLIDVINIQSFSPAYWLLGITEGVFNEGLVNLPDYSDYFNAEAPVIISGTGIGSVFSLNENPDEVRLGAILTSRDRIFSIASQPAIDLQVRKFYLSTSLSPAALSSENRSVKVFGNELLPEKFRFKVYNRWGLVIFETESLEEMQAVGWTGKQKQNGKLVPAGSYPYILRAMNKNGEVVERKGMISMVR